MKTLRLASAATLTAATLLLTACGGGEDVAHDPPIAGGGESESQTGPSESPTVGTYPAFEPTDYTYVLDVLCFCPLVGPVKVTVEDGVVTSAIVVKGGQGVEKGSDAPDYLHRTINEVIDAANDTEADEVEVVWPEGQDYPTSVSVDHDVDTYDEEQTWTISKVDVG